MWQSAFSHFLRLEILWSAIAAVIRWRPCCVLLFSAQADDLHNQSLGTRTVIFAYFFTCGFRLIQDGISNTSKVSRLVSIYLYQTFTSFHSQNVVTQEYSPLPNLLIWIWTLRFHSHGRHIFTRIYQGPPLYIILSYVSPISSYATRQLYGLPNAGILILLSSIKSGSLYNLASYPARMTENSEGENVIPKSPSISYAHSR